MPVVAIAKSGVVILGLAQATPAAICAAQINETSDCSAISVACTLSKPIFASLQ